MKKNKQKESRQAINDVSALRDIYYKQEYVPASNIAYLIGRVSSKKQEEKSSPKSQKRLGNEYTIKNDLHVIEVFSLTETAYIHEDRKIFNQILAKAKKSLKTKLKVMHLVFSHASRASRNKLSTHELRELVLIYGVVLHYFRDNLVLHKASDKETWDRWEKMHQNSEDENIERRKNTIEGMLSGYEEGYAQQNPPYGYRSVILSNGLHGYAFESPYSSYVERAFHLALTGDEKFKKKLDSEFSGIISSDEIPWKISLKTSQSDITVTRPVMAAKS